MGFGSTLLPRKLRALLAPQDDEIAMRDRLATRHRVLRPVGTILVQGVEDRYYLGLFGQIVTSLQARRNVRAEQLVLNSLRLGEARSVLTFAQARTIDWLSAMKWRRLYASFCDRVAYRCGGWRHPFGDLLDLVRARSAWRGLHDRSDLTSLRIDDVPVGDLVNDAYLRFKPAAQVDLGSGYLWLVIWNAYRQVRRAKRYFRKQRPTIYLTSYSTYVQHGVPVRVALQHGTKVYSLGNYQEFAKELSLSDWVHTKNPDDYARQFPSLAEGERKLTEANEALTARLSGALDSTSGYMKKSAYTPSGESVPEVQGAVVVFLHDFFDSPHVYRELVFADFWDWVCFTIETLRAVGTRFFLKPHPNQIDLSSGVLAQLRERYPGLQFVSSGVTNKQLVEARMACAVTVYGTVAHEMAYFGVPSIACARHPHVSFSFCRTARTREEYAALLRSALSIEVDAAEFRRQSLTFFYMHNLNLSAQERALRDDVAAYRDVCYGRAKSTEGSVRLLARIAAQPAFEAFIVKLSAAYPP